MQTAESKRADEKPNLSGVCVYTMSGDEARKHRRKDTHTRTHRSAPDVSSRRKRERMERTAGEMRRKFDVYILSGPRK